MENTDNQITIRGRIPEAKLNPLSKFIPTITTCDDTTILHIDHSSVPAFWIEVDISEIVKKAEGKMADTLSRSLERQYELFRENGELKDQLVKLELKNLAERDRFHPVCLHCGKGVINQEEMGLCGGCMSHIAVDLFPDNHVNDANYSTPPQSPKTVTIPDAPRKRKLDHGEVYHMNQCKKLRKMLTKLRFKYYCTKSQLESANIRLRTLEVERVAEDDYITDERKIELIDRINEVYEPDYSSEEDDYE